MNGNSIRTFLGANSSEGFASLYGPFTEHCRTVVIKGGPGSGKSGIIKKIASEAIKRGMFTEFCHCSSDGNSLDGIRIPEKNLCIVDGTAPHITEPKYPGAMDEIFYTGQFWNGEQLQKSLPEIRELSLNIKDCFARAYRYLSAAGKITEEIRATARRTENREKTKAFATELLCRNTKAQNKTGEVLPRFLSAFTPQGIIVNRDTVYTLASKVFVLDDPFGIGSVFLDAIIEKALNLGHIIYVFYNPLCPSVPQHVLLPEADLGIVTANKLHNFEEQKAYRIHMTRFLNEESCKKLHFGKEEKLIQTCIDKALSALKTEKAYHDDLEEFYIEAMDFKKLNQHTQKLIRTLFSENSQNTVDKGKKM